MLQVADADAGRLAAGAEENPISRLCGVIISFVFAALAESGVERLPAERRYARREQALRDGIAVSDDQWARLRELLA